MEFVPVDSTRDNTLHVCLSPQPITQNRHHRQPHRFVCSFIFITTRSYIYMCVDSGSFLVIIYCRNLLICLLLAFHKCRQRRESIVPHQLPTVTARRLGAPCRSSGPRYNSLHTPRRRRPVLSSITPIAWNEHRSYIHTCMIHGVE